VSKWLSRFDALLERIHKRRLGIEKSMVLLHQGKA
jgi:hypothetical protein